MRSQEDIQYLHDMLHYVLFQQSPREGDNRIQMRAVHDALCWILELGDHAEQEFRYDMYAIEWQVESRYYPFARPGEPDRFAGRRFIKRDLFSLDPKEGE